MRIIDPYKYVVVGGGVTPPAHSVGFWRGENDAVDSTGNGNDGSLGVNTTFNGSGHLGSSFVFDGTNGSKVDIPSINVGSPYSLEFWFKLNSLPLTATHLISNDFASSNKYGAMYVIKDGSDRKISYYRNSAELFRLPWPLSMSIWYKILYEYNGIRSSIWMDDVLRDVESVGHSETFNNALAFAQAVSNESNALNGELDEIVLYDNVVGPRGLVCQLDAENDTTDTLGTWNFSPGASTAYTTGHTGQGFAFTGSSAEKVSGVMPLGENFSIDFWMKPSGSSGGFVHTISNVWNSSQYGALYYRSGDFLEYWQGGSNRMSTGGGSITPGSWNRVTYTHSEADSKSRIYINGTLAATEGGSHAEVLDRSSGTITIGYGGESSAFSGVIDDIKFYNNLILP